VENWAFVARNDGTLRRAYASRMIAGNDRRRKEEK
jgi:hypothetical protein